MRQKGILEKSMPDKNMKFKLLARSSHCYRSRMNASMVDVQRLKGKEKSQASREVRCRSCSSWGSLVFLLLQE